MTTNHKTPMRAPIPIVVLLLGLLLTTCVESPQAPVRKSLPVVTTSAVTGQTGTTAHCGGTVTFDGGASVTARGVCCSTNPTPTIADSKTTDGSGTGSFTSSITGLTPATTYHVRAYATNLAGTGYGDVRTFTTPMTAPIVSTSIVTDVTDSTAQSGGSVTSDGGAPVTARGVCWSTSSPPTIADSKTTDGTDTGSFTSLLTGLMHSTTYFVSAYATNSEGTAYGEERSFILNTVTDIDSNVYQTIKIGDQVWMAENLKVTKYRDGTDIEHVSGNGTWGGLTTGAYCAYDNDENNVATYGRLYNWYAVSDPRGLAPEGWRVPTDDDWKQLEMYLGMSQAQADGTGWRGNDEGGKLKETGTTHWVSPNAGATNESDFSALPGGYRNYHGLFNLMGLSASFWSSTEYSSGSAWSRHLYCSSSQVGRSSLSKRSGFSVRCVRD